jgi:hypothetical protein
MLKREARLCLRMAAHLRLGPASSTLPLDPVQGLEALADAEDRRSSLFESVLLLADEPTIKAAREWQQSVWDLFPFLDAAYVSTGKSDFNDHYRLAGEKRDLFYACARRSLGIDGVAITAPYEIRSGGPSASDAARGPNST